MTGTAEEEEDMVSSVYRGVETRRSVRTSRTLRAGHRRRRWQHLYKVRLVQGCVDEVGKQRAVEWVCEMGNGIWNPEGCAPSL